MIILKPLQIRADRIHITIAITIAAMHLFPAIQISCCSLRQIANRRWIADPKQRRRCARILQIEAIKTAQQTN